MLCGERRQWRRRVEIQLLREEVHGLGRKGDPELRVQEERQQHALREVERQRHERGVDRHSSVVMVVMVMVHLPRQGKRRELYTNSVRTRMEKTNSHAHVVRAPRGRRRPQRAHPSYARRL